MNQDDTIVACATPAGHSSIAVIRISGGAAVAIARAIFQPNKPSSFLAPNRTSYGRIIDPQTGATLDWAVVAFFAAPHSYTGEDVIEISCHGSPLVVDRIQRAANLLGARPAQAGEFTQRAVLNGRLDLLQAEAVLDTIYAPCERARAVAVFQYEGGLSRLIDNAAAQIVRALARVEMAIDFSEDDAGDGPVALEPAIRALDELLATAETGRRLREGFRVVIAGRANVGKSTLFNALLGYDRAIVHVQPGTTRDYLEEPLTLGGTLVRLCDTAGMVPGAMGPDKMAVERSQALIDRCDLVLLVFDGSAPMSEGDIQLYNLVRDRPHFFVVNKTDLNPGLRERDFLPDAVKVSARTGDNIVAVRERIASFLDRRDDGGAIYVMRPRHIQGLRDARAALQRAAGESAAELIAYELNEALDALGELTGRVLRRDVLDAIFSEFCVGK